MTIDGVSHAIFTNLDLFFKNNPQLEALRDLFKTCGAKYSKIVAEKRCSCRVPLSQWGTPCFDALFETLIPAKKKNHQLVADFLRHLTRLPETHDMETVCLGVQYRTNYYDIFIDTREDTNG